MQPVKSAAAGCPRTAGANPHGCGPAGRSIPYGTMAPTIWRLTTFRAATAGRTALSVPWEHHCQVDNVSIGVAYMWDWLEEVLSA